MIWLALPLLLLSLAGLGYLIQTGRAVGRFGSQSLPVDAPLEPVTLLKPLHGAEPRLAENLRTLLHQDWPAQVQLLAGVQRPDDAARAIAEAIGSPSLELVVDATEHGANAKIGNLLNMAPHAAHDLLILSDSDIAVPRNYIRVVVGALAQPGVAAVSLPYRGRGDAGLWSVLAAGGISYGFLPSVLLGRALGRVEPCMGSTIALRRETLQRIGGFEAFRDVLADDGAIGAAVQGLGLHVAMPPLLVDHGCTESSFAALWRHELRWAATVRHFEPRGYRGLIFIHPLPFALLAMPLAPVPALSLVVLWGALRLWQVGRVDRLAGVRSMPRSLLPVRDCLSFALFVASFLTRSVDWRGQRLVMERKGRISRVQEFPVS